MENQEGAETDVEPKTDEKEDSKSSIQLAI